MCSQRLPDRLDLSGCIRGIRRNYVNGQNFYLAIDNRQEETLNIPYGLLLDNMTVFVFQLK